jgi:hypothetical protein
MGLLYISNIPSMYVFMGDFSKTINLKKKKKKKLLRAFVCLSLGLKKPGDFTVSEGHGYPLVLIRMGSKEMSRYLLPHVFGLCLLHCSAWPSQ